MHKWAEWLENSGLAVIIRQDLWLYPIIEIIHVLGVVMLVGPTIMFDLRVLGLSKSISVLQLFQHLLPWSFRSLLVVVPSGFLLFMTNAVSLVADPVFTVKLTLIALGGINALIFHRTAFSSVHAWERHKASPYTAKLGAGVSILIWISVICCGGLLAY